MTFSVASNSSLKSAPRGSVLGQASSSYLGVIRVDNSSIFVDANGTIYVDFTAVNSSISNLSSTTYTNLNTVSSFAYTNITAVSSNVNTLSSNVWRAATTSVLGLVTVDGTSLVSVAGLIIPASSSNARGARTIQSSSSGAPSNSVGNPGDIIYQY